MCCPKGHASSSLALSSKTKHASLAQMVERRSYKADVVCSIQT